MSFHFLIFIYLKNVILVECQFCKDNTPITDEPPGYIESLDDDSDDYVNVYNYQTVSLPNSMRFYIEADELLHRDTKIYYYLTTYIYPVKSELENTFGIKYKLNKPLKIPPNCDKYLFIDNETICSSQCIFRKCVKDIPRYLFSKCKYLQNNTIYETTEGRGLMETDFYLRLYVDYNCPKKTTGYYKLCARGLKDRPIMGSFTLCASENVYEKKNSIMEKMKIKHMLLHLLGFDQRMPLYFRNDWGFPLVKRDIYGEILNYTDYGSVYKSFNRSRQSVKLNYSVNKIGFVGRRTLYYARKHLNCSKLDGVDLFIECGKQFHFDELLYADEIMSRLRHSFYTSLSKLTLSFFEDTGWYFVDYSKADPYDYAENLGCDFAMKGCYKYIKENIKTSIEPYCNISRDFLGKLYYCSSDRKYYMECLLKKSKLIDDRYVYFTKLEGISDKNAPFYNSQSKYLEYCPIFRRPKRNSITSQCTDLFNRNFQKNKKNLLEDYFGVYSSCFSNTIYPFPFKRFGAACHKTEPLNSTAFYIYYKNRQFICLYNSYVVFSVNEYKVTINCGYKDLTKYKADALSNLLLKNEIIIWINTLNLLNNILMLFVLQ